MNDKAQESKQAREQTRGWEDEGGSLASEPAQKTPNGLEIPVPRHKGVMDALRKLVQPVKKKR